MFQTFCKQSVAKIFLNKKLLGFMTTEIFSNLSSSLNFKFQSKISSH